MDDFFDRLTHFVRTRRSDLAGIARSVGVGAEDAVDCLQEGLCTLLDMARHDTVPDAEAEWSALLAGIVRNAARNRRRRHFVSKPHEGLDDHPLTDEEAPAADELIALGISAGHVAVLLHRAKFSLRTCMARPERG